MKIENFAHKGLKRLYQKGQDNGVPAACRGKVKSILAFLEAMSDPQELKSPILRWKAHELTGNRNGTWALSVTANLRLTFRINAHNRLCDLNLEDYH